MQICRVIEIFQIEIGTYLTVADAIRPHLLVMLHTPFPLPLLIALVSTFHFRVKQQDRCVCVCVVCGLFFSPWPGLDGRLKGGSL